MTRSVTDDVEAARLDQRPLLWGLVLAIDYGVENGGPIRSAVDELWPLLPANIEWPEPSPNLFAERALRVKAARELRNVPDLSTLSEVGDRVLLHLALVPSRSQLETHDGRGLIASVLRSDGFDPQRHLIPAYEALRGMVRDPVVVGQIHLALGYLVASEFVSPDNSLEQLWLLARSRHS